MQNGTAKEEQDETPPLADARLGEPVESISHWIGAMKVAQSVAVSLATKGGDCIGCKKEKKRRREILEVKRIGNGSEASCWWSSAPNLITSWENECRFLMGHGSFTGGGPKWLQG